MTLERTCKTCANACEIYEEDELRCVEHLEGEHIDALYPPVVYNNDTCASLGQPDKWRPRLIPKEAEGQ